MNNKEKLKHKSEFNSLSSIPYRGFTLFCSNHLTHSINFITLIAWIVPLLTLTAFFTSIPCQGFLSPTCDYLFLASKRYRFFLLATFLTPLVLMFLLYLRIFVIITKNQKRRSQLTSHMSLSEPKRRADQLKCLTEEDHQPNGGVLLNQTIGQSNGRPASFDRYAQVPKINLEQKLTLKRSFYGKIAFLTRTLSSKSYTLKQQQQQQKLASQLNAFQPRRGSDASGKENDIISRTAANHHYESTIGGLANNESQLVDESSHRNSLIKKANTKLTGNRLIRSCGENERRSDDDGQRCECDDAQHSQECRLKSEDAANNNHQPTSLCTTCNVTNKLSYSNGSAANGSTRSKSRPQQPTKCPNKSKQTSLIKDGRQSDEKSANQVADRQGAEQQRSDRSFERQSADVRADRQPDEANGVQLGANKRPLLNKFRCDYCFGLSSGGQANCKDACRSGGRKASHTSNSLESANLEGHLSGAHLAEHNLDADLDCKDDCKLIKLADNDSTTGERGRPLSNGQSCGQSNGPSVVCLSGRRPISETNLTGNLVELDNLTSSALGRPKSAEQRTSASSNQTSNHRSNHANQANLSSNSSNLLSNKLANCQTNWPSSPDQTTSSEQRNSEVAQQRSPDKLTLELVKKSSTCSSKSFRSIKSVEIRDDLSVSGDPRREKPAESVVDSPSKLSTTRFNYPRKLRNKLNASIHGSRSVRFHTKALFTTLTILGTYLVCIMPALSAYFFLNFSLVLPDQTDHDLNLKPLTSPLSFSVFLVLTCVDDCVYPLFSISIRKRVVISMITNSLVIIKSITDPFIYIYRIQEVKLAVRQCIFFTRSADKHSGQRKPATAGKPVNYHGASINAKSLMSRDLKDLKEPVTIVENLETATGPCSRQASFNTASGSASITASTNLNTTGDSLIANGSSPTRATVSSGRQSADK